MIDYSLSRALKVIILMFQFGFVGYGSAQRVQDGSLAYYFVSNMLQSFNLSGQIEPNPGLDGSDIEEFLSILEKYDQLFKQDFIKQLLLIQFNESNYDCSRIFYFFYLYMYCIYS